MIAEIERLVARAGSRGHDAIVVGAFVEGTSTVVGWRGNGPRPDGRTLFEIGSITKPFTGVLLADMHLRGEVRLDDPLSRHLPDGPTPRWDTREPTLEELATHRAALPNVPRGLGRGEAAYALGLRSRDPWVGVDADAYGSFVRRTAARRPPGRRFRYSSLGFGLLGDALAARAGMPYEHLLRERICGPLGLNDTWITVPEDDRARLLDGHSRRGRPRPPLSDQMPAAGAIRTGADDLLRFLACSLRPSERAPGQALGLAMEKRVRIGRGLDIGLGWMILHRTGQPDLVWHNGGTWGFSSFAAMLPARQRAVVVLANTLRSVDRLGFELVDLLRGSAGPSAPFQGDANAAP